MIIPLDCFTRGIKSVEEIKRKDPNPIICRRNQGISCFLLLFPIGDVVAGHSQLIGHL